MLNENTAFSQEMLLEIIMKSVDKNTGYFDLLLQSAEYLEERIGRISGDVQDIKSSTTQINYKLDKMLEKINALENAFQDLKDETREVDQKIILMSSKLDRIEKSINEEELEGHNEETDEDDIQETPVAEKKIEEFVLSPDNDYSAMHSRDERVFSVIAYPKGVKNNDFIINTTWDDYVKISDIKVVDKEDATKITFRVTIDPSLLGHSSTATEVITLESTDDGMESDDIFFPLVGVEIFDEEPLTLNPGEPQVATFKVIPASLPLEELEIGINNAVDNLDAKIIDSDID